MSNTTDNAAIPNKVIMKATKSNITVGSSEIYFKNFLYTKSDQNSFYQNFYSHKCDAHVNFENISSKRQSWD